MSRYVGVLETPPQSASGPRAYSYVRFSTPEQARGDSLRRQVEAARRWAAAEGMELDESLRDLGLSAYSGAHRSRGSLAAFLKAVRDGNVAQGSVLVVENLDRLSREQPLDALDQLRAILRGGVDVVTLADGKRFTDTGLNRDFFELLGGLFVMARAHEESLRKAERVSAAWSQKRKRATAGEAMTSRCVAWCATVGKGRNRRHVLVPERAAVVRSIFSMAADGMGKRAITKALNAESVPTFGRSAGWQDSYVHKILTNRAAMGFGQPHRTTSLGRRPDGDEVPGYYPPAVTEAEFLAAGAARSARRGAGGRTGADVPNVFAGLCRCACGSTMVLQDKGPLPKGGRYFVCDGVRRGLACGNPRPRLRSDAVERAVIGAVLGTDWDAVLRPDDAGDEPPEKELARLRARRGRHEEKIALLLASFGSASAVLQVVAKVEALNAEVAAMAERIGELESRVRAGPPPSAEERQAVAERFLAAMDRVDGQERTAARLSLRAHLRQGLGRLVFDGNMVAVSARDGHHLLDVAVPAPEPTLRGAVARAVERVRAKASVATGLPPA